jgi:hypothetical protein
VLIIFADIVLIISQYKHFEHSGLRILKVIEALFDSTLLVFMLLIILLGSCLPIGPNTVIVPVDSTALVLMVYAKKARLA